jgi:hypothetical protein
LASAFVGANELRLLLFFLSNDCACNLRYEFSLDNNNNRHDYYHHHIILVFCRPYAKVEIKIGLDDL